MKNGLNATVMVESEEGKQRREIERINARMRHFRGVAASVMNDALKVWYEIWEVCRDPMTCEEIIDGVGDPTGQIPTCGWPELREKLHLLGHYIDYTKRLCDGSINNNPSKKEGEV